MMSVKQTKAPNLYSATDSTLTIQLFLFLLMKIHGCVVSHFPLI
uniref:Uncharacterized protein n=1 Tax=Anguilla anguilla TaxID=7936 RepID=A0A0E9X265_ANGAN